MHIQNIQTYQYPTTTNPNFLAASDLTLEYILKNNTQYLPERVLNEIKKLNNSGKTKLPNLIEVHQNVYNHLFNSKTLEEVKKYYPEFNNIIEITKYADNRSKAIKAVKERMPLEEFTLKYLKDVYAPMTQEDIVKKYGFTNRSLACWLNDKLNIKKLSTGYMQLLNMSDESKNNRIAELSRKALYANAEAQKYRLERAAEAHRTPEYRAKKRQEMIDFYNRNPEAREKVREITQTTWDLCPEVKKAMAEFTKEQKDYVQAVIRKQKAGQPLSIKDIRVIRSFYKEFWEKYDYLKTNFRNARYEAVKKFS